jgi:hypothetical protein
MYAIQSSATINLYLGDKYTFVLIAGRNYLVSDSDLTATCNGSKKLCDECFGLTLADITNAV